MQKAGRFIAHLDVRRTAPGSSGRALLDRHTNDPVRVRVLDGTSSRLAANPPLRRTKLIELRSRRSAAGGDLTKSEIRVVLRKPSGVCGNNGSGQGRRCAWKLNGTRGRPLRHFAHPRPTPPNVSDLFDIDVKALDRRSAVSVGGRMYDCRSGHERSSQDCENQPDPSVHSSVRPSRLSIDRESRTRSKTATAVGSSSTSFS
jgi:hypothetical protein